MDRITLTAHSVRGENRSVQLQEHIEIGLYMLQASSKETHATSLDSSAATVLLHCYGSVDVTED